MCEEINIENLDQFDCVAVVRCHKCKYSEPSDLKSKDNQDMIFCKLDGEKEMPQWRANDYCSYGDKKE